MIQTNKTKKNTKYVNIVHMQPKNKRKNTAKSITKLMQTTHTHAQTHIQSYTRGNKFPLCNTLLKKNTKLLHSQKKNTKLIIRQ